MSNPPPIFIDKAASGEVLLLRKKAMATSEVRAGVSPERRIYFMDFAREVIRQEQKNGRVCMAERYATVLNSFARFLGKRNVSLDKVDSDLMAGYEHYLKSVGVCPNTSSFYMRGLRAIYNRAVEKGLTQQRNPFRHVYTGVDKTVKRAVPIETIRRIRDLKLDENPLEDFARDMFMFSFYMRGMSFVDMAFLRKEDLKNGFLSYRRRKTGQRLSVRWERQMQEIVDKYDTCGSVYLLPIIRDSDSDERRQYKNCIHLVNAKLREMGKAIGLATPLTSYVARHSWASIAKSKDIPLAIISEAMGHDSEKTTRIYLDSLDTLLVDRANSLIINSL